MSAYDCSCIEIHEPNFVIEKGEFNSFVTCHVQTKLKNLLKSCA